MVPVGQVLSVERRPVAARSVLRDPEVVEAVLMGETRPGGDGPDAGTEDNRPEHGGGRQIGHIPDPHDEQLGFGVLP